MMAFDGMHLYIGSALSEISAFRLDGSGVLELGIKHKDEQMTDIGYANDNLYGMFYIHQNVLYCYSK